MNSKNETKPISVAILRDIASFIKNEPWSVLIIVSLVVLPRVFSLWKQHFPSSWEIWVNIIILVAWIYSAVQLRAEIILQRRKTILFYFLKKHKWRSIAYLSEEWEGKKEFTKKNIEKLLLNYPEIFRRVPVKSSKGTRSGVGLVEDMTKKEVKEFE